MFTAHAFEQCIATPLLFEHTHLGEIGAFTGSIINRYNSAFLFNQVPIIQLLRGQVVCFGLFQPVTVIMLETFQLFPKHLSSLNG